MDRIGTDSDITLFSRFECKYLLDPVIVPEVREYLRPFMRPDAFAEIRDAHRYPICSLYLDSDDLKLYYQTVEGWKNRFKLRARTYSDLPSAPVFLEVKRKINNIVQKHRARVDREVAQRILELRGGPADFFDPDVEQFSAQQSVVSAKPVVKVKYLREAYESIYGDPLRITLDTELCHAVTLGVDCSHAGGRWVNTPTGGVILEIKFTEHYPAWVSDMVRLFGMKQQPVPKYVWSVDHALNGARHASLSLGRKTLPPSRI